MYNTSVFESTRIVADKQDEMIWGLSSSGSFSIKSALELHHAEVHDHRYAILLEKRWKLRTPFKLKTQTQFIPYQLAHKVAQQYTAYCEANPLSNQTSCNSPPIIKWYPPPESVNKLNFDGSVHNNSATTAGVVVRDSLGQSILAGSKKLGVSNVLVVEAQALREGLLQLHHHHRFNSQALIIEGDSEILIEVLNGRMKCLWRIKVLVHDIHASSCQPVCSCFISTHLESSKLLADVASLALRALCC
ncbi:hypothetical protein ACLB2K_002027 [Fragaria x ananassa]